MSMSLKTTEMHMLDWGQTKVAEASSNVVPSENSSQCNFYI